MEENKEKLKHLSNKNYELQRQSFSFLFQIIPILGVPAFLAAYYGKKIGIENESHPRTMIIFMLIALAFSWTIIFARFMKFKKDFQKIGKEIKQAKDNKGL